VRNQADEPLGFAWRDEVEALVREAAGELDASRLTHSGNIAHWRDLLDDLARQAAEGREFAPSKSWDAYVETMGKFKQDLDAELTEGERIRGELFTHVLDADQGDTTVRAWLRGVDNSFAPVPRLRQMLRNPYPAGASATYEDLSEAESRNVWHVDLRLQELQPLLAAVAPYVQALKGE
jgi:hypothetical protein